MELLYEQLLLREHDLWHRAEVAGSNRRKAKLALAEAEKEITGLGKLLPFLAKSEKAAVDSAARRLQHWEEKENDYLTKHAEAQDELDVATLTKIREEGAEDYIKGQGIKDFYSLARERVDVFRAHVRDFLKALGQARGAMSTGYNRADDNYSQNAKNSLEVALKLARKLDLAVSDITLLNAEFKAKATNTPYSQISMPNFSHADYEAGVRRARTLPIAQAQIEFEKTLEYCEQLHDEGISDIIEEINALENTHEDIMLKIVREHWRGQQSEILRDREKVEKIRAEIGLD